MSQVGEVIRVPAPTLWFRWLRAKLTVGTLRRAAHTLPIRRSPRGIGLSALTGRGLREAWAEPSPLCQADDMRKYVIMGIQGSGKGTQANARPAPEVIQQQIRECLGLPPYQPGNRGSEVA
jgi:hypothetical protein